ncbi:MAG TPA: hypothetical protein VFB66_11190 [Tepidisphaeraceae bacterium]|nr:hypothetical protein [Tepidisphaeraceae bacterium]
MSISSTTVLTGRTPTPPRSSFIVLLAHAATAFTEAPKGGVVRDDASLRRALGPAGPGSAIVVAPGTHRPEFHFDGAHGTVFGRTEFFAEAAALAALQEARHAGGYDVNRTIVCLV